MVPFVYLPGTASVSGLSEQEAAMLVSMVGIANTLGRVLCGWVSDKHWVSPILTNAVALVVTGFATMAMPEAKSFSLLAFFAFTFGIGVGKLWKY